MSRAARRELPDLVIDLNAQLLRLERMGDFTDGAKAKIGELHEGASALALVRIGIAVALNNYQHEIGQLGEYFWEYDERQAPLEEMIKLIHEFLESPRYGLEV